MDEEVFLDFLGDNRRRCGRLVNLLNFPNPLRVKEGVVNYGVGEIQETYVRYGLLVDRVLFRSGLHPWSEIFWSLKSPSTVRQESRVSGVRRGGHRGLSERRSLVSPLFSNHRKNVSVEFHYDEVTLKENFGG